MATGLPVLASRVGGFPLQIREGVNGFLVPPGDEEGFCEHVVRLRRDAALRARLREGSLAFAGPLAWEKSASLVAEIYERVVSA